MLPGLWVLSRRVSGRCVCPCMRRRDSGGWVRESRTRQPMYIDIVPNRGSPPAILLRESIRDGKRVRKRTIANLSALPIEQAEMIRRVLKGEKLGPLESALDVVRSQAHGHVEAVLTAMRRLGFDKLDRCQAIARARPCRRHGGRAHHRARGEQARHDAGVGRYHAARRAGRRRRRRGLPLRGHGLADRAPARRSRSGWPGAT